MEEIKQEPNGDIKSNSVTPRPETPLVEVAGTETVKLEKSGSGTPNIKRQKTAEPVDWNFSEPIHEVVGGSSIRQYLNQHITPHILEGLHELGTVQPENPLEYLGNFLLERSKNKSE